MVKFDLVLTNGRIHVETIDDAEGTPGSSRQYTRFNAECKPELDKLFATCDPDNWLFNERFMSVLADHRFACRNVVHVRDADGNLTNHIRIFADTFEVPDEWFRGYTTEAETVKAT